MKKLSFLAASLALVAVFVLPAAPSAAGKKSTKITVGNNFFNPESKTIQKGTTVKFKWTGGGAPHDVIQEEGPGRQLPVGSHLR